VRKEGEGQSTLIWRNRKGVPEEYSEKDGKGIYKRRLKGRPNRITYNITKEGKAELERRLKEPGLSQIHIEKPIIPDAQYIKGTNKNWDELMAKINS